MYVLFLHQLTGRLHQHHEHLLHYNRVLYRHHLYVDVLLHHGDDGGDDDVHAHVHRGHDDVHDRVHHDDDIHNVHLHIRDHDHDGGDDDVLQQNVHVL